MKQVAFGWGATCRYASVLWARLRECGTSTCAGATVQVVLKDAGFFTAHTRKGLQLTTMAAVVRGLQTCTPVHHAWRLALSPVAYGFMLECCFGFSPVAFRVPRVALVQALWQAVAAECPRDRAAVQRVSTGFALLRHELRTCATSRKLPSSPRDAS